MTIARRLSSIEARIEPGRDMRPVTLLLIDPDETREAAAKRQGVDLNDHSTQIFAIQFVSPGDACQQPTQAELDEVAGRLSDEQAGRVVEAIDDWLAAHPDEAAHKGGIH